MEQIKCYCGHTTYCDCDPLEEQSAVEWLQDQYDNSPESILTEDDFNQAKEMELEKLKEAYSMGRMNKSIKEFNETFNPKEDDKTN
jgi:hypothetical protein